MIRIYEDTKVYVAVPKNLETGGPEALHQLIDSLLLNGIDAYLLYINMNFISCENFKDYIEMSEVPKQYQKYKVRQASDFEDNAKNVLVFPEIYASMFTPDMKIQKAIWWLAVPLFNVELALPPKSINHLYQSEYAKQKLIENGITEYFSLSDYTRDLFMNNLNLPKEDIVLYNPRKGIEYTKQIIDVCPDIKFVPLKGMTPVQVHEMTNRARLYIDFGHHPGKDRFPREAAISGCCVITWRKGSAGYFEDVPIPDKYKVEVKDFNPVKIGEMIRACLNGYDDAAHDFDFYRKQIKKEKETFSNEVKAIFSYSF